MFEQIEMLARRICAFNPNCSSSGKCDVISYTCLVTARAACHTDRLLKSCNCPLAIASLYQVDCQRRSTSLTDVDHDCMTAMADRS